MCLMPDPSRSTSSLSESRGGASCPEDGATVRGMGSVVTVRYSSANGSKKEKGMGGIVNSPGAEGM